MRSIKKYAINKPMRCEKRPHQPYVAELEVNNVLICLGRREDLWLYLRRFCGTPTDYGIKSRRIFKHGDVYAYNGPLYYVNQKRIRMDINAQDYVFYHNGEYKLCIHKMEGNILLWQEELPLNPRGI